MIKFQNLLMTKTVPINAGVGCTILIEVIQQEKYHLFTQNQGPHLHLKFDPFSSIFRTMMVTNICSELGAGHCGSKPICQK